MRVLLVSDTHGRNGNFEKLIRLIDSIDLIFHMGDLEGSEGYLEDLAPCPIYMVSGNNDFFTNVPAQRIVPLEGHRIFMVHGHRQGVSYDTEGVKELARENDCDYVFFGHTHRPLIDQNDPDIIAVNPGSLSHPRQENRKPSYILLDIDRFGEWHFTINYMEKG